MSVTTQRPPATSMQNNTVVESSFSAVIHALLESLPSHSDDASGSVAHALR